MSIKKDNVKNMAKKWYGKIRFPIEYDAEFKELLETENNLKPVTFEEYDTKLNKFSYGKNLIMFLYFCEELSQRYKSAGIPCEIFTSTVSDFVVRVQRCRDMTGKIGLDSAGWMSLHMSMRLFRIGRLQFCMSGFPVDIPQKRIRKGENALDVHIPPGDPLYPDECIKDIRRAEDFFAEYFPNFDYRYFTCFSWLLDDSLKQFLNKSSNILQFQKMFEPVYSREEDSILHFMFKYGLKSREEIRECPALTEFAKKIKEYALAGGVFHNVLGVRKRYLKEKEITI